MTSLTSHNATIFSLERFLRLLRPLPPTPIAAISSRSLGAGNPALPKIWEGKIMADDVATLLTHLDIRMVGPDTRMTENGGWAEVADGGTITHNIFGKPRIVNLTPSGTSPISYSFQVTDTEITVHHTSPASETFSWYAKRS